MALSSVQAQPPTSEGWVVDPAQMLSRDAESRLEVELTGFNDATDHFVAVLMVPASAGTTDLPAYARGVLHTWGLEAPDKLGVILLCSADGSVALQVTTAAAARLTPALQTEIMLEVMAPALADGNPDYGVETSVRRMMAALGETPGLDAPAANAPRVLQQERPVDAEPEAESVLMLQDLPPEAGEEGLPENLGEDFERFAEGLAAHPGETLEAMLAVAGQQLEQLPDFIERAVTALGNQSADAGETPGPARAVILLAALVALALGGWALVKGAWGGVLFCVGVLGAPLLALSTGWLELSLCLALVAFLSPVAAGLLKLAAAPSQDPRQGADERWAVRPGQVVPRPQAQRAQPPRPAARASRRPAPMSRPASAAPGGTQVRLTKEEWNDIRRHVGATVGDLLPKITGGRAFFLLVLFVLFTPLAVATLLALLAWSVYRIATLDEARRERLMSHPKLRAALLQLERRNPAFHENLRRMLEQVRRQR